MFEKDRFRLSQPRKWIGVALVLAATVSALGWKYRQGHGDDVFVIDLASPAYLGVRGVVPAPGEAGPSEAFVRAEVEIIRSRNCLGNVCDDLHLQERWGISRNEAVAKLRGMTTVQPVAGTSKADIHVKGDRDEVRALAGEVAVAYHHYRQDLERREADRALSEFRAATSH